MFQVFSIALAQVNSGNTFQNYLNEIRQVIYSLYQAKEITKKVNPWIQVSYKTEWIL